MNILSWVAFGLAVGVAAHYLDSGRYREGLLGTVLLGVLGSLLGGFLGDLIFGLPTGGLIADFSLSSFIVAVTGALVLLFVSRSLRQVR